MGKVWFMQDTPFFSVIIPTRERLEMTRRALDSVLSQDYLDYEVILVDDGSRDGTPSLADEYSGKIRYLRREHGGVSRARNDGVRMARGEWLAFLDSDDTWLPEKLSRDREFIRKNPEIQVFQCEERWIRRGRFVNKKKKHTKKEGDIFLPSLELCLISPSAVVMAPSLFTRYGPFDPLLPACEDYTLWLPVTAFEYIGYIPETGVVKYGGHEDQLSRRYHSMDRFRVYGLCSFIDHYKEVAGPEKTDAARAMAHRKLALLEKGARKHGNEKLEEACRSVRDWLAGRGNSSKAYRTLAEI
jgi:glycosyltransferase involved in cell wall biosynthesis